MNIKAVVHDTGEVDQLVTQLDSRMNGLDDVWITCASISASDQAAWGAFYGSWRTLSLYWHNLRANSGIINSMQGLFDVEGIIGTSIYDQVLSYKNDLPMWEAKIQAACPGQYTPPPAVTLPDAAKPPATDWGQIAQMALTGAIALGTGLVLYKGLSIVEDFTSHARKA
jgi:hypothetical protein